MFVWGAKARQQSADIYCPLRSIYLRILVQHFYAVDVDTTNRAQCYYKVNNYDEHVTRPCSSCFADLWYFLFLVCVYGTVTILLFFSYMTPPVLLYETNGR